MPEEYTSLRIRTNTRDRLNKTKHDLYKESFDDTINALIDEYESRKKK